jgi:dsDNA-specific endonuclease/ATPase MutS2
MLEIQLAHFHKALDAAIVHQLPDITFIHGAGNGTLRNELHKQWANIKSTNLYGCP